MSAATGTPADESKWGRRVVGGDPLHLNLELTFDGLGRLCKDVARAHKRTDFREHFEWIEDIQPVTDPHLIDRLEHVVNDALSSGAVEGLDLAPPDIVDWTRLDAFQYHCNKREGLRHPDLRLVDYLAALARVGRRADGDVQYLRQRHVGAIDVDGQQLERWSLWRCLVGEVQLGSRTYVLDEGDFFAIRADYLRALNTYIDGLPVASVRLPSPPASMRERDYNEFAVANDPTLFLLDRRTVQVATTTPIEICDILTTTRQLVHVKRHLGARDLSHLFSQGVVAAELLQMSPEFRAAARAKIAEHGGGPAFDFFDPSNLVSSDFEVVYAIIADWRGRKLSTALPFFSKINLRRATDDLRARGFRVSQSRVAVSG